MASEKGGMLVFEVISLHYFTCYLHAALQNLTLCNLQYVKILKLGSFPLQDMFEARLILGLEGISLKYFADIFLTCIVYCDSILLQVHGYHINLCQLRRILVFSCMKQEPESCLCSQAMSKTAVTLGKLNVCLEDIIKFLASP